MAIPLPSSSSHLAPSPLHPLPTPSSPSEALSHLTSLLNHPLRLTLPNDRLILGILTVIDPQCNIILSDAEEFVPPLKPPESLDRVAAVAEVGDRQGYPMHRERRWGGRGLGLVLVPGEMVVKVEVEEGWVPKGDVT